MDADARARLQRHSRWLAHVADFMLLGTVAALTLPVLLALPRVPAADLIGGGLLEHWIVPLPHLYAVFAVRQAFAAYARGGVLGRVMTGACRRAGWALAVGAAVSAFGAPLLGRWLDSPRYPGSGTVMMFDTAYMATGVVGLALVLLAGLIERAVEAEARVQALEGELKEFV